MRSRNKEEVISKLNKWIDNLDPNDSRYEHHRLEALWVMWGLNQVDVSFLEKILNSSDFRVRSAAVRVLRYNTHQIKNYLELLNSAANDEHGRVRLEAITFASWLTPIEGNQVLEIIKTHPLDQWSAKAYDAAKEKLNPTIDKANLEPVVEMSVEEAFLAHGKEIYQKDGYCGTCHQDNGKGLIASNYPPLLESEWVTGNPDRLIKLSLKGLYGPITVAGKDYPGIVPMTPYEGLLNDQELASVLTYVRQSFGNSASKVTEEQVAKIRKAISDKEGFYAPSELLQIHPFKK